MIYASHGMGPHMKRVVNMCIKDWMTEMNTSSSHDKFTIYATSQHIN